MQSLLLYFSALIITLLLLTLAQRVNGSTKLTEVIWLDGGELKIRKSLFFIISAFLPLWYIIAFRDRSVGKDAFGTQYWIFRNVAYGKYYDFANFGSESGYFFLNKICAYFSDSYHLVLLVTGTLSWGAFYYYIVKNSQAPRLSIILFFLSFNYFHQFNTMRQFIACGIVLCGFKYIYNRNFIKYLLTVLIAFLFHKIAIITIVFYFLFDIKVNTKMGLILVAISKISINVLKPLTGKLLYGTRYYLILNDPKAYKSGYLFLEIVLAVVIYVLVMIAEKTRKYEGDKIYNFNLWLTILALMITINSNYIPIPYRILWYVNINNIIFLPQILLTLISEKKKVLATSLILLVYIFYFSYEWYTGVDGVEIYALWKA